MNSCSKDSSERSCGTCLHRAYGDQRLVSQCALKVLGDPDRKRAHQIFRSRFPKPRARNFGRKCWRWELQTDGAIPSALRLVGINSLDAERTKDASEPLTTNEQSK